MSTLKRSLYSIDRTDLVAKLKAWGYPGDQAADFAQHIWQGVYKALITDFHQMADLPLPLRSRLSETYVITRPEAVTEHISADQSTRKVLLKLADGVSIESVLLRYRERYTVCVSTQVGCACGCDFCATGKMGFVRNLTRDEIVAQVVHFQRALAAQQSSVSNVVFMGMGEPLLNQKETFAAIERLLDPRGLALAPSRLTLSTVGIAPGIETLAERHKRWPIKLAVSLHAATNALRTELMPINSTYPLEQVHAALVTYTQTTGRHVLLEWVMIAGVNDTPEQAEALVTWLNGLPAHVNLIQLNPTDAYEGEPSSPAATEAFSAVLDDHDVPHTMRQRRGGNIDAGCGQLTTRQAQLAST